MRQFAVVVSALLLAVSCSSAPTPDGGTGGGSGGGTGGAAGGGTGGAGGGTGGGNSDGGVDAGADAGEMDAGAVDAGGPSRFTGENCDLNAQCLGTMATCIRSTQVEWPAGYCSSRCNVTRNDPNTGVNTDCPGGAATCVGQGGGTGGQCFTLCGAGTCRPGYACFAVSSGNTCNPQAFSQCDPNMAGSCSQGACAQVGPDPVGECLPGCNVFMQDCSPGEACYTVTKFGEGACAQVSSVQGTLGSPCSYTNDCQAGMQCFSVDGGPSTCSAFCGGPSSVTCDAGNCVDLSATVPSSTVGACYR